MTEIFISYSHFDVAFFDKLSSHLSALKRANLATINSDRRLFAGDVFGPKLKKMILNSEVFLALITENYFTSDYCFNKEYKFAIKNKKTIIPIICGACAWEIVEIVNQNNALPRGCCPIGPDGTDETYSQVSTEIGIKIKELQRTARAALKKPSGAAPQSPPVATPPQIGNILDPKYNIDILRQSCEIYDRKADQKILTATKNSTDRELILDIDFNSTKLVYAGYYVRPIVPKNWVPFIINNYFLRFDAIADSDHVNSLIIEMKGISYQMADIRCKLLSKEWKTINIPLGGYDLFEEQWQEMKEICFVVKPNCLSGATGRIRVRNLRLEKDSVS